MISSKLPFQVRTLGVATLEEDFGALLPATTRSGRERDQIVEPTPDLEFLDHELSVKKINDIQDWLWVCGRPMPPRPLHHQTLLSRTISITEDPELHLVWHKNRIFIKPLPLWLLSPSFWSTHLLSDGQEAEAAQRQRLAACARGFLFSYTALIAYQSDFTIAQAANLLPESMTWIEWKTLTSQFLASHCYATTNPRYWYGELRMSRLNKVYVFRKSAIFRGYSRVASHAAYEDLLQDNFATLATVLGYVVIVLTAMQVGLGVEQLQTNQAFQDVSYGFTIFSMVAPLVAAVGIMLFVIVMFGSNYAVTKKYEIKRFRAMGVEPFWRGKMGGARGEVGTGRGAGDTGTS
ncbi:hypothetical protein B0J11DRAFT_476467 [Dendryphion nanum]|uniref:Uncharacterized protein n=1 Tax=Dendryphion nanum TaxID=256645 RepID=A0A9P9EKQ6_9PLEO|nr:hypothetical protein B0J11DRAFT_476467 [Dendryphion nanum]